MDEIEFKVLVNIENYLQSIAKTLQTLLLLQQNKKINEK